MSAIRKVLTASGLWVSMIFSRLTDSAWPESRRGFLLPKWQSEARSRRQRARLAVIEAACAMAGENPDVQWATGGSLLGETVDPLHIRQADDKQALQATVGCPTAEEVMAQR